MPAYQVTIYYAYDARHNTLPVPLLFIINTEQCPRRNIATRPRFVAVSRHTPRLSTLMAGCLSLPPDVNTSSLRRYHAH